MNMNWHIWICTGMFGCVWVCMDIMGMYGYVWV